MICWPVVDRGRMKTASLNDEVFFFVSFRLRICTISTFPYYVPCMGFVLIYEEGKNQPCMEVNIPYIWHDI